MNNSVWLQPKRGPLTQETVSPNRRIRPSFKTLNTRGSLHPSREIHPLDAVTLKIVRLASVCRVVSLSLPRSGEIKTRYYRCAVCPPTEIFPRKRSPWKKWATRYTGGCSVLSFPGFVCANLVANCLVFFSPLRTLWIPLNYERLLSDYFLVTVNGVCFSGGWFLGCMF